MSDDLNARIRKIKEGFALDPVAAAGLAFELKIFDMNSLAEYIAREPEASRNRKIDRRNLHAEVERKLNSPEG